jgi:aminoglycoside phosphotransferase (APT) family kinase protein
MIYEYTEEIPQRLPMVLHDVLGYHVRTVERLQTGQVTYAFRVETDDGPVLVKVFRYAHEPRRATITFVEESLGPLGVRIARTRHFDAADTYFPHGFLVADWIAGSLAQDALAAHSLTREAYCTEVAAVLRQVHVARFDAFGYPPLEGAGQRYSDFVAFMRAEDRLEELHALVAAGKVDAALLDAGRERLAQCYAAIDFPVQPVLVHGDPSADNVIRDAQGLVLIDWDNAHVSSWVHDLAWLTFWYGPEAYDPFMRGYGTPDEDEARIRTIETALHMRLALQLPLYFAFALQDDAMTAWSIQRLRAILSDSG